jgi:hypothetical protein
MRNKGKNGCEKQSGVAGDSPVADHNLGIEIEAGASCVDVASDGIALRKKKDRKKEARKEKAATDAEAAEEEDGDDEFRPGDENGDHFSPEGVHQVVFIDVKKEVVGVADFGDRGNQEDEGKQEPKQ